jgi:hypothetical protein
MAGSVGSIAVWSLMLAPWLATLDSKYVVDSKLGQRHIDGSVKCELRYAFDLERNAHARFLIRGYFSAL